jgi:molybdenum cofactor biosynthesis enzyme MoaA
LKPTKCKWPLNHISVSSTGLYRPCCAWEEQPNQITVRDNSIADYLGSDFYIEMVEQFRNDKYAAGCAECMDDEKSGIHGLRNVGQTRYPDQDNFKLHDMEIKFGNLCNAGCIMCSSYNSSLIQQEQSKHPELMKFKSHNEIPLTQWYEDPDKFNEIVQTASSASKVRFTGGEPTIQGLLTKFLTQLSKLNTDVDIQITSNGSSYSNKLHDVLKKFKKVNINVSIDGYGAANDFIRWPIAWDKLEQNVDVMRQHHNVNIEISLQSAGVDSLPQLIEWCESKSLPWNVNSVYEPTYLQPYLAADHIKEKAIKIGDKKINTLLNYSSTNQDRDQLRKQMLSYFDTLSNIRGINWKDKLNV